MMIRIKNILLLLVLTVNIVFTQYPSASFEYDEYLIDENSDRASVTLQIDNPDLVDLGGITIFLYADPSVIKFDSESVSWNSDSPFQHESLTKNVDNDTLKIGASTGMGGDIFSVPFASIFDISFDIIGVADDNSLIEFITFQLGGHDPNYTENTTPTNIILVGENSVEPPTLGCTDVDACNYNSAAVSDDGDCEYSSCAGCDDVPNSGLVVDECGVCGGDGYISACVGADDCDDMDCAGDCKIDTSEYSVIDECGICGGNNYGAICLGTDGCVEMDCAGVCGGSDSLTPCGDCSDDSDCNFSVSIATFTDLTIMDNNFRSDNIEIPISLNDFDFAEFSQLSPETQGFEGMAFSVNFDPRLLEANSSNSIALIENMSYNFGVSQLNDSLSIISGILTDYANDPLYQSLDGPIANLSFDVIESRYTPELHGNTTAIEFILTSLNAVDISEQNIRDTGTLTIYTKACIDPFASTLDSNFICDVDDDVCDDNGILEESNIFNDGCILPEPDFEDVLSSRIGDEKLIVEFDTYTLTIPEGTVITFPDGETSLDLISSASVDINFLPDVAPGAQLAGSLIGIYPFGTIFSSPIELLINFEELSRGVSEYKILYMDDIQTGDWEEIGSCSGVILGKCMIEDLTQSGLFIVMFGENLAIDESTIPSDFNLFRSYPNPFNPTTTLEFDVANSGLVNFTVYNISGQIVESMAPKFYTPGNYKVQWEARDVSTGIYLIQMKTESSVHLQKVMLLK